MAKAKKKRASKYEDKLSIKGTFEDVIKVSMQPESKANTKEIKNDFMNWKTVEKPSETGPYLVSVMRQRSHGRQAFKYIAHYNKENDKWYKYDPYDDNYKPTEEISGEISAWNDDLPTFIK